MKKAKLAWSLINNNEHYLKGLNTEFDLQVRLNTEYDTKCTAVTSRVTCRMFADAFLHCKLQFTEAKLPAVRFDTQNEMDLHKKCKRNENNTVDGLNVCEK